MPKKVYKINNFHGGLNNSSDPRDVDDKEITAATNVMVDEVGRVRLSGSNYTDEKLPPELDNPGAGVTQTPGSGLFYFSHDRKGGEDAGDDEANTGDYYLALYDDSDAQVWVYSQTAEDWDDDKDSNENGVINFLGKSTSLTAKPCFFSVDGAVRVSTGEFSKYASGSLIDDGSHFLTSETSVDIDTGGHLSVGNYVQIDDEVLYVTNVSSNTITFRRGIFGTKITQHDDDSIVYILNMNQWYGYLNNKLFQTSTGSSVYDNNKWYNNIQHLRSLDDLGIELGLYDAETTSPASSQISQSNKIVVSYWYTTTKKDVGFWNGSYYVGLTPVYEGGQEGPISTVKNHIYSGSLLAEPLDNSETAIDVDDGDDFVVNDIILVDAEKMKVTNISTNTLTVTRGYLSSDKVTHLDDAPVYVIKDSALNINEEILNIQLYITHPDLDGSDISSSDGHPLLDERIIGLKLYTKNYTSDEWFLLKEFDLLEGGEHGWETYNSDAGANITSGGGNTLTGFWKTTSTADSLTLAAPSDTTSYGGPAESNTCTATLNLNESKGTGRVGTLRLVGFDNSPLYLEVSLSSTSSQGKAFDVVIPAAGTHKFIVELLDENFNIMARAEQEQAISDSGVDASPQGGSGGSSGSGSS